MLHNAQAGRLGKSAIVECSRAYQLADGTRTLSDYYKEDLDTAVFEPFLRKNLVFTVHNLVCDASLNEFHAIFCRNVLIYFDRTLQASVHKLIYESLATFGYLGLGRNESIRFSPHEKDYEIVSPPVRLYRKIK
jgi:chemotaxis protein methyltransferase CheR